MMADAIKQAQKMHRAAIESTYSGVCSVYEYEKARDDKTKLTKGRERLLAENVPCKLSFSSIQATDGNGTAVSNQQSVKLFLAPEIAIKAGSKIVVTQDGVENAYQGSSEPAVYPTHQEINLKLFERWT